MELTPREKDKLLIFTAALLAERRKARGRPGQLACVDKANVFRAFAFMRAIFAEEAARQPDIAFAHYNLGLLYEARGKRSEAIRHLHKARALYGRYSVGR